MCSLRFHILFKTHTCHCNVVIISAFPKVNQLVSHPRRACTNINGDSKLIMYMKQLNKTRTCAYRQALISALDHHDYRLACLARFTWLFSAYYCHNFDRYWIFLSSAPTVFCLHHWFQKAASHAVWCVTCHLGRHMPSEASHVIWGVRCHLGHHMPSGASHAIKCVTCHLVRLQVVKLYLKENQKCSA